MRKVYAVWDSKVEAHADPIFARTNGEAIRMFTEAVNREGTAFSNHAADYTLMLIGEWDDIKGELKDYSANVSLGNALEFKTATPRQNEIIRGIQGGE